MFMSETNSEHRAKFEPQRLVPFPQKRSGVGHLLYMNQIGGYDAQVLIVGAHATLID
jgi:hypothetical protein